MNMKDALAVGRKHLAFIKALEPDKALTGDRLADYRAEQARDVEGISTILRALDAVSRTKACMFYDEGGHRSEQFSCPCCGKTHADDHMIPHDADCFERVRAELHGLRHMAPPPSTETSQ